MKAHLALILTLLTYSLFSQDDPVIPEKKDQQLSLEAMSPPKTFFDFYKATDYPKGIYYTKEDFLKKIPNDTLEIKASSTNHKGVYIFKHSKSGKKIRRGFAIRYRDFIYFQNKAIINPKFRDSKDKAQTMYDAIGFAIVRSGSSKYLYLETELHSAIKQGWLAGSPSTNAASYGLAEIKGVVWDFENQEFNIFRHCKDLNIFLVQFPQIEQLNCHSKMYDLEVVREIIEKIK